ncbi:hypothetical protein TNIN_154491 [Trichonephila inaurata madagascariensis]|uniref:Uncharacterized protein n=1 Tax=Trichonephila inaurata madagascariensis TaxID=2747483 RepID=A0A8X6YH97_9ARAC|nr:hypothetical protein TNIN_154491 [Trichonephila inaurata madagascariensis]
MKRCGSLQDLLYKYLKAVLQSAIKCETCESAPKKIKHVKIAALEKTTLLYSNHCKKQLNDLEEQLRKFNTLRRQWELKGRREQ